jgi:6-phosphogluconolactonase
VVGDVSVVSSGGACPRNFALSPDGRWLIAANQDSNNLAVFARDEETGGLKRTDQTIEVDSPVCVIFCE